MTVYYCHGCARDYHEHDLVTVENVWLACPQDCAGGFLHDHDLEEVSECEECGEYRPFVAEHEHCADCRAQWAKDLR